MAVDTTNDQIFDYTTLDIAPTRYQTLTGTCSSDGTYVTGAGTLFLSEIGGDAGSGHPTKEIGENAWLFNGTNEIRRIIDVTSDTNLVIDKAFTVALSGAAVKFVPNSNWQLVSYLAVAAGGKVNGLTLAAGENNTFVINDGSNKFVSPIIVDGTGGTVRISKFANN